MRLFVAAELPSQLLDALAETQAALRSCVHGRYVAPDQLHVTLAFLGEVASSAVDDVADVVWQACEGHAPFEVRLAGLGSFGRRNASALWQGFATDDAFDSLARDVRGALSQAGFSHDAKRFMPHVTLMRAADVRTGELPMPAIADGTIDTVTLFLSDLSGARPAYTALSRVALQA